MKILIALIGKAGSGKDRLLKEICRQHPEYYRVVHTTTRPKREHEIDGIDYNFITTDKMTQSILNGNMMEVTEFRDWFYGTDKNSIKEGINIGVFNPESYYNICDATTDVKIIGIYIRCHDKIRLIRQLNREENPDVHEIVRRFSTDENDFVDIENDPFLHRIWNEKPEDIIYICDYIQDLTNNFLLGRFG